MTLFAVLSYIFWQRSFSIYRYAVVLELLAPLFLTLGIFSIVRPRWMFYSVVLLLNSLICWYEIPLDFGREPFVEGYLRVNPPAWDHLGESVVLMAGIEGSAYIIPSFPSSTRFVRVESTFTSPGINAHLDEKIRAILAQYSPERTLVYLHNREELKTAARALLFYGINIDAASCVEVVSTLGNAGYLCRTSKIKLELKPAVTLEVTPKVARVNKDTLVFRVFNLNARAIDMLYTLDGKEMPPIQDWRLDSEQTVRTFVSKSTRKGIYHIIGIRDALSPEKEPWVRVDVEVEVR